MLDTTTREYVIKRMNRHSMADLGSLHAAVYGKVPAPGYFQKKYDTTYTGTSYVGYLAYNKDKIPVAFYGVIPCFIQHGDKLTLAAQSADTMTHPRYRFKGMFVELSNITFDLCRELGIRLVFGFPNQNSYHGAVNKLGWKMTDTMSCFVITVKTIPFQSLCKTRVLKKLYIFYSNSVLRKKTVKQTGLPNSVLDDGFAGVCRNADYLTYKTYNARNVIRLGEVMIWFTCRHKLMIGDMHGVSEQNFGRTIKKLKRVARLLGLNEIQFHCSPGTSLHRLFSAQVEPAPSYPMLFQDFGATVSSESIHFTFADIDIF